MAAVANLKFPSHTKCTVLLNQYRDLESARICLVENRRYPQEITMDGGFCLHGLQSAKQTSERMAVELWGSRTVNVDGGAVPSQCDPYSLYVQLPRYSSLDGIMLLWARDSNMIGRSE